MPVYIICTLPCANTAGTNSSDRDMAASVKYSYFVCMQNNKWLGTFFFLSDQHAFWPSGMKTYPSNWEFSLFQEYPGGLPFFFFKKSWKQSSMSWNTVWNNLWQNTYSVSTARLLLMIKSLTSKKSMLHYDLLSNLMVPQIAVTCLPSSLMYYL